jgi:hypothetical protein
MDDEVVWGSLGGRGAIGVGSLGSRRGVDGRSPRQMSAVTNGRRMLADGDNRGPWVRRLKDVIELHISDLGGLENASEAERSIIRRAAVLRANWSAWRAGSRRCPMAPATAICKPISASPIHSAGLWKPSGSTVVHVTSRHRR